MDQVSWRAAALTMLALLLPTAPTQAHGFAGKRFFPATIATDDPFVADELSLPTVRTFRTPGAPPTQETDVSVDLSKRITPSFGIGFGETWQHLSTPGSPTQTGFGTIGVNAKYLLLENDPHELLFSIGIDAEIGGTGAKRVGAERFSTVTPGIFFGKGFGDLPDGMRFLKPLAITGVVGYGIPTVAGTPAVDGGVDRHPNVLNTGIAIEYSLQYLQSFVQDIGLGAPFNRLIPLIELNVQTPLNRGRSGQTTGTINPGFIWAGQYYQVGVEAILPVNGRTGNSIGGVVQLHFFLDDLLPKSIGKPIFGG